MMSNDNERPAAPRAVTMTESQRQLILDHTLVYEELRASLSEAPVVDGMVRVDLPTEELDELVGYVAAELGNPSVGGDAKEFERLHASLDRQLEARVSGNQGEHTTRRGTPPEVREALHALIASGKYASLDELNVEAQRVTDAYNQRPQEDLCGFSPQQVFRLLYGEWNTESSAVRTSDALALSDVADALFFFNVRTLLQAVLDCGKVKATSDGNLNRAFVRTVADALRFPPGRFCDVRKYRSVVNEADISPLHVVRVVAKSAGLLRREKGQWSVTAKGEKHLADPAAGKLYQLFFNTYFCKFNMAYADRMAECPNIQHCVGVSLCAIARHCNTWQTPKEIAAKIFLPTVRAGFPSHADYGAWLARARILQPLADFGLLECRDAEPEPPHTSPTAFRKTPLYDAFLHFDL